MFPPYLCSHKENPSAVKFQPSAAVARTLSHSSVQPFHLFKPRTRKPLANHRTHLPPESTTRNRYGVMAVQPFVYYLTVSFIHLQGWSERDGWNQ